MTYAPHIFSEQNILSDLWGNRLSITEPNAGKITSTYNGFNELETQTDALGNKTTYKYDDLGRVTQKKYSVNNITKQTIEYIYDINRVYDRLHIIGIDNQVVETFTYDYLKRLAEHSKKIDDNFYIHKYTYTDSGQLRTLTYPDDFSITYNYTPTGKLNEIRSSDDSLIYRIKERNIFHSPALCQYGNEIATKYSYNSQGLVTCISAGNLSCSGGISLSDTSLAYPPSGERGVSVSKQECWTDSSILYYQYTYNNLGLMTSRFESVKNRFEAFEYDSLDRLTQTITGKPPQEGVHKIFSYSNIQPLFIPLSWGNMIVVRFIVVTYKDSEYVFYKNFLKKDVFEMFSAKDLEKLEKKKQQLMRHRIKKRF